MNLSEAPVSVVIPCYRCAGTIGRAVESVAAQTVRPAEVILVDDCSGDDTLDALRKLQAQYSAGWIKIIPLSRNGGPGSARNAGWDVATQTYLAFLDSDDSWHPQKIALQYDWMVQHRDAALTGHERALASDENMKAGEPNFSEVSFRQVSRRDLLFSNRFPTSSVMLERQIGHRFAEGKRYSEDYLLWLLIADSGKIMARCDVPFAFAYKAAYGSAGLSARLWDMERGELDTYHRLWKSGGIGMLSYAALGLYSMARHIRRLVISAVRA